MSSTNLLDTLTQDDSHLYPDDFYQYDPYLNDLMKVDFEQYLKATMTDEQPLNDTPPKVESSAFIPLSVLEQEKKFTEAVHYGESQLPLGFTTVSTTDSQIFNELSANHLRAMTSTTELPGLGNVPATSYCGVQLMARTSQAVTSTVATHFSPSQLLNTVPTHLADHEVPRSPKGECRADVTNVMTVLSSPLPTYGEQFYAANVITPPVPLQGQAKRGRPPVIKVN